MKKELLILFCFIFLTGCSSGGSDSPPPTSPSTVFTLFDMNVARPGTSETFNLTGSDTTGITYTSTVSIIDRGLTTFMSQSLRQTDFIISLTASNGGFATNTGTSYGDPSTFAGLFATLNSGVTCTASSIAAVPLTAKPG